MAKILTFILIFNFLPDSYASNFNWKFSVDSISGKSIGNEARTELVDDWKCTIGTPKEDKFGNEMRRFGCGPKDGGLQAYLLTTCIQNKKLKKPTSENGCLNLQMSKSGSKTTCLYCE